MSNKSNPDFFIGLAIKRLRKKKGLTLEELADIINTSQSYLSEIERGIKIPGSQLICSLKRNFRELDLNVVFLIEGENDPKLDNILSQNDK